MGCKTDFQDTSMVVKIAFVIALIANFCNWIGFTTSWWARRDSTDPDTHFGLWRTCTDGFPSPCTLLDGQANSRYIAIQTMAILGFVFFNFSFIAIILYIWYDRCKDSRDAGLTAVFLAFFAAATWLAAIIVFALRFHDTSGLDLYYSFGLACCATGLAIIVGILMIIGSRSSSSAVGQRPFT